jgi:hypothetical protein
MATTTTTTGGLRAARKEQAAARAAAKQRHPAKGAAKAAPAKAPAKQPAKKAPAKAAPKAASTKVRWTRLQEGGGAVEQDATCGGHTWQLRRAEGGWTVKQDGKRLTPKPVAYAAAGKLILAEAAKAVA